MLPFRIHVEMSPFRISNINIWKSYVQTLTIQKRYEILFQPNIFFFSFLFLFFICVNISLSSMVTSLFIFFISAIFLLTFKDSFFMHSVLKF